MSILELLAMFGASFVFVFAKAFQQRNVMGAHYALILVTSYAMAAVEVFIVWKVALAGPSVELVAAYGTAGGTGA